MTGLVAEAAHRIRVDTHAVWLAARDRRTPFLARLIGLAVAAYALSPIDLIPDFIPILGLVDDVILVPIGIWLFVKLVPDEVFAQHRAAAELASHRPISRGGAVMIIVIWMAVALLLGAYIWSWRYW